MNVDRGRKIMVGVSGALVVFVLLGGLLGRTLAVEGTYSFLKLFNEVLYLVRTNYVEPVEEQVLMEGAYRGMLESLDPQSEYLTAAEFEKAMEGERSGPADVGLILSKRRGYAVVITTRAGSEAEKAGLTAGDQVLNIEKSSTLTMGVWEASQALQGEEETEVELSVVRTASPKREKIVLKRTMPVGPPVTHEVLEPGMGILRLRDVNEGDSRRVAEGLEALRERGVDKVILDLRANAASNLEETVKIASLFTGGGLIVQVLDRHAGDSELRAPRGEPAWKGNLVVLVDRGTADAGEVLAAALRDRAGAKLVGENTWGMGSTQEFIPLAQGDGIRISVGKYLSPNGEPWNGTGLAPDVVEARPSNSPNNISEDPQVQRGLELLRDSGKIAEAA